MSRILTLAWFVAPLLAAGTAWAQAPKIETNCTDRIDNDGDGLADCGDSDCASRPECKPDGGPENTDERCSDFVDNDNDGRVDCDDSDCQGGVVTVCKGSWKGPLTDSGHRKPKGGADGDLPPLGKGQTVEDLIGKYGDKDGERNDVLCSDGVDNDGDGKIDCADFGCRFDPEVTVCRGSPGMRFSIVANVAFDYDFIREKPDVRFSKLQLRSFGPMPFIQDSFYLISLRTEKTPRLTFAMFQIPLGKGHFLNVNSGGGGLSNALVLSSASQLLLDPPFYLYSAFDQGNGAAVELYGPIDDGGIVRYRAYVAGGSGLSNGNVGGRFFAFDNTNFTYGGGAAFEFNITGRYSRWDTQFLYTVAPLSIAVTVGAKYDQRAQERYVAFNTLFSLRWKWFAFAAENYTKKEFEFDSWQTAYNIRLGVLLVPKHLMFGADFGEFIAYDMQDPPKVFETELRRQKNELQWRLALHWYFYKNVGVASLLYRDREVEPADPQQKEPDRERALSLVVQYRF